jgi:hypothetical protein
MKTELKELAIPPENLIFNLKAFLFKVSHRNPGKMRFSATAIAMLAEDTKTKERYFMLLDGSERKLSQKEMDAYMHRKYPKPAMPMAPDRVQLGNPANPTLNVHSTSQKSKGGL